MYEVVKTVNGHDIYRMKGTRGFYHVRLNKHKRMVFKTIKAQRSIAASYKRKGGESRPQGKERERWHGSTED